MDADTYGACWLALKQATYTMSHEHASTLYTSAWEILTMRFASFTLHVYRFA